jgi:hypothetical protein
MHRHNITILGDSRAFDTYYLNDQYDQHYGYDKAFPFLLRTTLLLDPEANTDIVHIPDHFRGGTKENNILRIALTNPMLVYLIDGIWETLLNKDHFTEYADKAIAAHPIRAAEPLRLELSHEGLARLFEEDKLSVSPGGYASKIGAIASYFRRRRRACAWMNLIKPNPDYRDGIHYAGNYKRSPVWNDVLDSVNRRVGEELAGLDAQTVDLHALMERAGGEQAALLDQWHFTAEFHDLVAAELAKDIEQRGTDFILSDDHVSHRHMLPNINSGDKIIPYGGDAAQWVAGNHCSGIEGIAEDEAALLGSNADIVMLCHSNDKERKQLVGRLLGLLPKRKIILFPEEMEGIVNPKGAF